jgi:hypothetical protein
MIPLICLVGRNLRRVDYLQGSWPDRNKAKILSLIRDGKARRGRSLSCPTRADPVRQVPTASAMQPAPLPRPIAANDPRRRVRMRMDRFPMSATKSKPSAHESRWPRVQEHHGGLGRHTKHRICQPPLGATCSISGSASLFRPTGSEKSVTPAECSLKPQSSLTPFPRYVVPPRSRSSGLGTEWLLGVGRCRPQLQIMYF